MPWWHALQHWLAYHTGSLNEPGAAPGSAFCGGIASDAGEVSLLGGLLAIYRKHQCATRWCFRFGHHDFADPATRLVHRLCRAHHPMHPGRPLTRAHITLIHKRNRGGRNVGQEDP